MGSGLTRPPDRAPPASTGLCLTHVPLLPYRSPPHAVEESIPCRVLPPLGGPHLDFPPR
jgi:hypothetical protein